MANPTFAQTEAAQDSRIFGSMGGRVIAIILVALLFWYYLVGERADARRKLTTYSPEAHAATYKETLAKLKETATESDGGLVGMGVIMGVFLLIYEGAASGIGWLLVRLAESPRTPSRREDRG